jgi:hypothetical protein
VSHTTLAPELARALSAAHSLRAAATPPPAEIPSAFDEERPWPGLASLTEELMEASRELRHLREACGEAERQLSEHEAREEGLMAALVDAWRVTALCVVLAIVAVAGVIFVWWRAG